MVIFQPSEMVLINFAASLILIFSIIVYKYLFPLKKLRPEYILPIILFIPTISLLRPGDFESGDFNIHIYRIMSFYESLREGILMPSWAGELNNTYGYPLFIFNYQFPYYAISLLKFLGFSFISATKFYLALNLFFSGIFMYLMIKKFTRNSIAGFIASILYTFSPYHLIDVHFRATLGEVTIFTFAPLLFYALISYIKSGSAYFFCLTSLSIIFLFMSHSLLAGLFLLITLSYLALLSIVKKNIYIVLRGLPPITLGIIGSIYSWISFFIFKSQTLQEVFTQLYLYPFINTIYAPWKFGLLFQGPKGELALLIGYSQICLILIGIFLLFSKRAKLDKKFIFWMVLTIFTLFMTTPISYPIWNLMPTFLWQLTPTGRLMLIISFLSSIVSAYIYLSYKRARLMRTVIFILVVFAIFSTILNWGHRRMITSIDDNVLRSAIPQSTRHGEGHFYANSIYRDPKNPWFDKKPENHLEVLTGKAQVKNIKRESTRHLYEIVSSEASLFKENTLFFSGWQAKSNNNRIVIFPLSDGSIGFNLPQGKHQLELKYSDPFPYSFYKKISLFLTSTIFIVIFFILATKTVKLLIKD